jgi:tyrosyl-tRNA synthetase
VDIVTLIVDARLARSKSEARRYVQQGSVSFFPAGEAGDAQRINDIKFSVPVIDGAILKVGKLQYIRIKK